MAKKVWSKGRIVLAGLCGVVALSVLTIWGCGTKGYDDVAAQKQAAADAAVTTTKAPAVIDAVTLKAWVDQGKLNAPSGNPDRVVVVSLASFAAYSTATRGHIPGAVLMETSTDLTDTREEGLGAVSSMMLTSSHLDTVVKKFGIDGNTTIVLTIPRKSSDLEAYQQSVAYFTYRYWGFARNRIKILNGGDDAWDFAGYPLATHARTVVTPSSYSVKSNGRLKDVVRYSISETLLLVDAINKDPGLLATWQMLDARGLATTPYVSNALRAKDPIGSSHGMMFLTDRVNGEAARNRLYPDKATLLTRMATNPVVNGSANEFLSPDKKTLVMCGSSTSASPTFVLFDAVLGVPEGNIMMYDGSSGQWGNYGAARLTASALAGGATAQQAADFAAAWAFDAVTPGTAATRSTGGALTGTGALLPYLYLPTQPEMNQVEEADRAFMAPASPGTTTTTTPTGGSSSGNAGGGC
jgi:thiosulfate/3-mercaptopyruvate sulfurtransferase